MVEVNLVKYKRL